tara:strand:+ start:205 stop:339 length:135 start_codon:yes stop_codon:yes gene_type:complete
MKSYLRQINPAPTQAVEKFWRKMKAGSGRSNCSSIVRVNGLVIN